MSIPLIPVILCAMMVVGAVAALYMKNLTSAVIASGAVGLLASIVYLFAAAPDVAMTEAAIGSGLTTVVFLYALHRIRAGSKEDPTDD